MFMDALAYLLLIGVLLGLGILAAAALPTPGLRVGLGAVAALAAIVDLTWLLAPLIGWSAGLGDAAWIAVFVAATGLALRRQRSAPDRWHWPPARDLAALLLVSLAFGAVLLVLPVPLDTDAQGFGYLALMLRDGGDYMALAPWHPEIEYLYAPAQPGLVAHLSARFTPGIHVLQMALGAAVAALVAWAAYDLGCELSDRRLGRAFLLAALGGTGLLTAFMDSHYTALLALAFSLGFLTFALRALHAPGAWDGVLAAICLAAVPLSQPDTTIALIIGYAPWLLVVWLARPRPTMRAWLTVAVWIPLGALLLVAPWLVSLRELLGSGIESPFEVSAAHWRTMVIMHGGAVVLLAAIGALASVRRRSPTTLLALVWLVAIVEFSTLGLLERTFPALMAPLLKYDYPFSLAWHGPIIPYTILGGSGLLWLADRLGAARVDRLVRRLAYPALALGAVALLVIVVRFDPLLAASKDAGVRFYGAFSSAADVAAMQWLRDHAPAGARVLNHPGPHEGDWAPVIAERDTVFFRPQPFFRGTARADAEQEALRAFWRDPADLAHRQALLAADVRYVLVPQVFADPDALAAMVRWRPPLDEAASYAGGAVGDAPYLRLVFDRDGAQVYEVVAGGG
jgi:hypothetical protein